MSLSIREAVTPLAEKLGLYRVLRGIYRNTLGTEGRERRRRLKNFYSQFVAPGDLVFDIGANIGVYTEVFVSLGAKVVAVEPNPECVRQILRQVSPASATVIQSAVGDKEGTAKLNICSDPGLSSMNADWVNLAKNFPAFKRVEWAKEIEVNVTTIDLLCQKNGQPKFLKIDVEGYEDKVLAGMSTPISCISFEFASGRIEIAQRCLQILGSLYLFNYTIGEEGQLELSEWVSSDDLRKIIPTVLNSGDSTFGAFGDVIARHRDLFPEQRASLNRLA